MAALRPEDLVDLALQVLGHLARPLGERLVDLLGHLLELVADELRVRARGLAVEHARADLDRVDDRADRVLAALLLLAHEADGALVGDDEAVHGEAIADGADYGLPEWCCGFHKDFRA